MIDAFLLRDLFRAINLSQGRYKRCSREGTSEEAYLSTRNGDLVLETPVLLEKWLTDREPRGSSDERRKPYFRRSRGSV